MSQTIQPALVQAANEFVNQVFYGPLLRELRESQRNPYFDNGPGGKTFIRQLDMEMVKRMNGNKSSPLAQALIRQLGQNSQATLSMMQTSMQQSNPLPAQDPRHG